MHAIGRVPPRGPSRVLGSICKTGVRHGAPTHAWRPQPEMIVASQWQSTSSSKTSRQKRGGSVGWLTAAQDKIRVYSQLSKYRLSTLVVFTTSAGYLTAGGPLELLPLSAACLGTMLASSSASTLNQVIETENDSLMKRTRNRPLPSKRISRPHALGWAAVSGGTGIAVLAAGTNPITAALGAGNLFMYSLPYTLSKTRTELNTWIGSLVGAIPPVMGWTAATGGALDVEPLLLAGYLFLWQFPHFFALSWLHREDYARGGFKMVPCADPTGSRTAGLIARYSAYLLPIPLVAAAFDATSWMFAVEGTALNAVMLYHGYRFHQDRSNSNARKVFRTSLWHLPVVLALFVFHSRNWWEEEENLREGQVEHTSVQKIRSWLKGACIHEIIVLEDKSAYCPAVVAEEAADMAKRTATAAAQQTKDQEFNWKTG
ncbi:unnamed protein product [Choristocarpus tenellus]